MNGSSKRKIRLSTEIVGLLKKKLVDVKKKMIIGEKITGRNIKLIRRKISLTERNIRPTVEFPPIFHFNLTSSSHFFTS